MRTRREGGGRRRPRLLPADPAHHQGRRRDPPCDLVLNGTERELRKSPLRARAEDDEVVRRSLRDDGVGDAPRLQELLLERDAVPVGLLTEPVDVRPEDPSLAPAALPPEDEEVRLVLLDVLEDRIEDLVAHLNSRGRGRARVLRAAAA